MGVSGFAIGLGVFGLRRPLLAGVLLVLLVVVGVVAAAMVPGESANGFLTLFGLLAGALDFWAGVYGRDSLRLRPLPTGRPAH